MHFSSESSCIRLDSGPPNMKRTSTTSHREECHYRDSSRDQPKNHVYQVNPHGVLHPLDTSIDGLCMDINLCEDPEDSHP